MGGPRYFVSNVLEPLLANEISDEERKAAIARIRADRSAIEPSLQAAEIERARAKATNNLEAYDLYLRALPEFYAFTEQGFRRAEALLGQAVERDPGFADAWGALADCRGRLMVGGWTNDWDADAALREAHRVQRSPVELGEH